MGPSYARVASRVLSLVARNEVQRQTVLLGSLGVWREPNVFIFECESGVKFYPTSQKRKKEIGNNSAHLISMYALNKIFVALVLLVILSPFVIWVRLAGINQPTLENWVIFWASVIVLGAAIFFTAVVIYSRCLLKKRK